MSTALRPASPASSVSRLSSLRLRNPWLLLSSLVLGLGLLLRVVVWWQQRSIVLDEANLIRNYVERSYGQLFENLDYAQYAPPLFSVAVKACIGAFGNNELSVRLFPLLCSMATLGLFRRLVQRWLPPAHACLALAFVAFGALFVDYATECKQYATDGFVALGLLEVAHWAGPRPLTGRLALGLAGLGMAAVWLSMTSVFVLAGIGLWWLTRSVQNHTPRTTWRLLLLGAGWAVSFLVYFWLLLKANAESTYLQDFHRQYFLAFPPRSGAEWRLLGNQLQGMVDHAVGKTVLATGLAALGACAGIYHLLRRRDEAFWLLLVPIAACFTASALHYYSLLHRLTLFFLPLVVLVVFLGLQSLSPRRAVQGLLLALAVVVLGNQQRLRHLITPFYGDYAEVRTGLEYISRHQRPGEVAFMNFNVAPIARYYLADHDRPLHMQSVVLQQPHDDSTDIFQAAVRAMPRQGIARAWLLYDRRDESFNTFAATQGRILQRYNFERGYVLLLAFPPPVR